LDWLPQDSRVKAFIERDEGMYDAINRGLRRAQGEILSYLNCDEQYLPGALAAVNAYFRAHPEIDMLFADFVVVDARGDYLFHRKVQTPLLYHTWVSHLSAFTCATFFRRRLVTEESLFFNPALRIGGDAEWMVRVLRRRVRMATMRQFTSVFTLAGHNLSAQSSAALETASVAATAPWWARHGKPFIVLHHRWRRLTGGVYSQKPFTYEIYDGQNVMTRTLHQVAKPTFKWKRE